jgi:hypothetical protein
MIKVIIFIVFPHLFDVEVWSHALISIRLLGFGSQLPGNHTELSGVGLPKICLDGGAFLSCVGKNLGL